jgi:hypothetical protein
LEYRVEQPTQGVLEMAIKVVNFSFAVPIEQLLALVVAGNVGMKVDVFGTGTMPKPPKMLKNGHAPPLLLEGPKKPHGNIGKSGNRARGKGANGETKTAYTMMLEVMAASPDYTATLADLRPAVAALGLSASSANSQTNVMRQRGHAKRIGEGVYQLTKPGVAECEKRGIRVSGKSVAKKPVKEKKKKVAAAAPVAAETDNG